MTKTQAAILSFKVLKLCNRFLKDYKSLKKDYDIDFESFDDLVVRFVTENVRKQSKKKKKGD